MISERGVKESDFRCMQSHVCWGEIEWMIKV